MAARRRLKQADLSEIVRDFGWLLSPLMQFADKIDNFDPRDVQTTTVEMRRCTYQAFTLRGEQVGGPEKLFDQFSALAGDQRIRSALPVLTEQMPKHAKRAALKGDSRYSLIMKLVGEADSQVPFASILAFEGIDPVALWRGVCEPLDLLQAAERGRGERRAVTVQSP